MTYEPKITPPPGVYRDVPNDIYHSWPAIGSTTLKHVIVNSPAHARASKAGNQELKRAFEIGDACDAAVLTPDLFAKNYAIGPDVKLNTTAGKQTWDEFARGNPGKKLIRGADAPIIEGVRNAVWSHPLARKILEAATDAQLTVIWEDHATGLMCKARPDIFCAAGIFADLKTTRSAKPKAFARQACELEYPVQLAHYREGINEAGLGVTENYLIAVEKAEPFPLVVFQPTGECAETAIDKWHRAMQTVKRCMDSGVWPGYSESVEEIDYSRWSK